MLPVLRFLVRLVAIADFLAFTAFLWLLAWLPWPGRHQVELLDAAGKVVDRIGIEVRGASARAPSAPARR